ncbi:MAG: MBL fold metallo-hydrolase [Acidimicrobiales bacterium]
MATLTFHGVRGSCPCSDRRLLRYGGATACVAVQPDQGAPPVVLDLGTGSRLLGEELVSSQGPGDRLSLSAFVTHLHFDHVQGLPFFAPALRDGVRLDIYGPCQEGPSLEETFAAFVRPPYFPIGLRELPAEVFFHELRDGQKVTVGEMTVLARDLPHRGPTVGYRVECDGRTVAYLGDHQEPVDALASTARISAAALDLAGRADVLIHDAQYTREEFEVKAHWGHSTVAYAVEVAQAAEVGKLVLFHHDPTHDDDLLDRLGAEAAELAGDGLEVLVAAEGLTLKLGD